jgi:hypothetical protein
MFSDFKVFKTNLPPGTSETEWIAEVLQVSFMDFTKIKREI